MPQVPVNENLSWYLQSHSQYTNSLIYLLVSHFLVVRCNIDVLASVFDDSGVGGSESTLRDFAEHYIKTFLFTINLL